MINRYSLSKKALVEGLRAARAGAPVGFDYARASKDDIVRALRAEVEGNSEAKRRFREWLESQPQPLPVAVDVECEPLPVDIKHAPTPYEVKTPTPKEPEVNNEVQPEVAESASLVVKSLTDMVAALSANAKPGVDEERVRAIVAEALQNVAPRELAVKVNDAPAVKVEGRVHPLFDKVLRLVASGVNVMLVGPAGCGKTHLAGVIAKALGREFHSISGSTGVSEAQLVGRLLPTGDGGKFEYVESPFVKSYQRPSVFLFDEIDAFDPNCLLTVNQATANGGFEIEARAASGLDTFVKRHEQAALIASANTFGTGSSQVYVGRGQLDAATLDRWYVIEMDYDTEFEASLAPEYVVKYVKRLREVIKENKLRRVASTRMIQRAVAALAAGVAWEEVKSDLVVSWTDAERAKI